MPANPPSSTVAEAGRPVTMARVPTAVASRRRADSAPGCGRAADGSLTIGASVPSKSRAISARPGSPAIAASATAPSGVTSPIPAMRSVSLTAVPLAAVPLAAVPGGPVPAGLALPETVRSGSVPLGSVPSESVAAGSAPAESSLAWSAPSESSLAWSAPTRSALPGLAPAAGPPGSGRVTPTAGASRGAALPSPLGPRRTDPLAARALAAKPLDQDRVRDHRFRPVDQLVEHLVVAGGGKAELV